MRAVLQCHSSFQLVPFLYQLHRSPLQTPHPDTHKPPPPLHPLTRVFLSRSYSTLLHFIVNSFNYSACQWMQDVDTILSILPFPELSFGCALEWQYHIHPSRGLSILLVPKVKEPLLSSSYILSEGKYIYLNFRLARRHRISRHWVAPLKMAPFSITLKIIKF